MNYKQENLEPQFASMDTVVMKKDELLEALVKNKAKHDTLYQVSVSGYWELATSTLDEKRKNLSSCVAELKQDVNYQLDKIQTKIENKEKLPSNIFYHAFTWNNSLVNLTYPENHTNDYERAISIMKSSIYNEVKLSVNEYDKYVLNNWEWKNQFVSTSNFIISAMTGCYNTMPTYSGCYITPTLNTVYNTSVDSFQNDIKSKNFNF